MYSIIASPLPTLDTPWIKALDLYEQPNCYSTYNVILRAEQHAVQQGVEEDIIAARITGYLLLEFHAQSDIFGNTPCSSLARIISQTVYDSEQDVIFSVGKLYRDKFIRLFRTHDTHSTPPLYPSCPFFHTLEEMIKYSVESGGRDSESSGKALARDGFRCLVTGVFDEQSFLRCKELQTMADREGAPAFLVQTSHILNEPTMQCIEHSEPHSDTTSAAAILEHFGFSKLASDFAKLGDVHQVGNLLSLQHGLYYKFGRLTAWFESIRQQPGRYKVCLLRKADEKYIHAFSVGHRPYVDGTPMIVEFTSHFERAPLPNPDLLALHATCARVVHMSGASSYFDKLEQDMEEMEDLVDDG